MRDKVRTPPGHQKGNTGLVDRSGTWRISAPRRGSRVELNYRKGEMSHEKAVVHLCPIHGHAKVGFPELVGRR